MTARETLIEILKSCQFKVQRHESFEMEILPHVRFRYYGGTPYLTWDVKEELLGFVTTRIRVRDLRIDSILGVVDGVEFSLREESELVRKFGYETRGYGLYWKRTGETVGKHDTPVYSGLRMEIHHNHLFGSPSDIRDSIEILSMNTYDDSTSYGVLKEVGVDPDCLLNVKYDDLLLTLVEFERERMDLESIAILPPEGRDLIMKMGAED